MLGHIIIDFPRLSPSDQSCWSRDTTIHTSWSCGDTTIHTSWSRDLAIHSNKSHQFVDSIEGVVAASSAVDQRCELLPLRGLRRGGLI